MRIARFVLSLVLGGFGLALPVHAATLQPERLPGMCITMSGPDGASQSQPCDGSAKQEFELPGPEGGPIRQDGKCVAPRGDGYYPELFAEACDGSQGQTWKLSDTGELRSGAGRCIAVLGMSSRSGERVYGAECLKDREGQAWRVMGAGRTEPVVRSFESRARPGKCIGYDSDLMLLDCTDAYGQLASFDLQSLSQIRMMSSCFAGGYAFDGLSLGECWDLPAQRWTIMDNGAIANRQFRCIEVVSENGRDILRAKPCRDGVVEQQWTLRAPKGP